MGQGSVDMMMALVIKRDNAGDEDDVRKYGFKGFNLSIKIRFFKLQRFII